MAKGENNNYDKAAEWKNWLVFINNTHKRLDEIERIGEQAYFDKTLLNRFFAMLRLFCANRKAFIDDYPKIRKILETVGDELFSERYLRDFYKNKNRYEVQAFQYRTMKALLKVLEILSVEFSDNEITFKVKKIMRDKEQNSRMKGVSV